MLPLMGARRPASGKAAVIILVESVFPFFLYPAGRVAPICACVHWLHSLRLLPDGKSFLSVIIRQSTKAKVCVRELYTGQILHLVP